MCASWQGCEYALQFIGPLAQSLEYSDPGFMEWSKSGDFEGPPSSKGVNP